MIELYEPFYLAPPELQALSCNGGDEDWLAVFPPGHPRIPTTESDFYSPALRYICGIEIHHLTDGRVVIIGSHA